VGKLWRSGVARRGWSDPVTPANEDERVEPLSGLGAARPFPPAYWKQGPVLHLPHKSLLPYGKELVNALGRRKGSSLMLAGWPPYGGTAAVPGEGPCAKVYLTDASWPQTIVLASVVRPEDFPQSPRRALPNGWSKTRGGPSFPLAALLLLQTWSWPGRTTVINSPRPAHRGGIPPSRPEQRDGTCSTLVNHKGSQTS